MTEKEYIAMTAPKLANWNAMYNANALFKDAQKACGCSARDAASIIAKTLGEALNIRKRRKLKKDNTSLGLVQMQ